MLVALLAATAFGDSVRHIVHVELAVPTPTRQADDPEATERGEPQAMALPDVRAPRKAPKEGDVPMQCSSQSGGTGDFVDAHDAHRPRLFLRDGVVWFERQPLNYPTDLAEWPTMTCVWEGGGRLVEYAVSWKPMTTSDRCLAEQVPAVKADIGVLHDFESGLPASEGPNGIPLGFSTFDDGSSTATIATTTSHPSRSGESRRNDVLKLELDVERWAGTVFLFPDAEGKVWSPVDMTGAEAISFWFHGANTGNSLYFHLFDNRLPCSTADDAERFTFPFKDDFEGWRQVKVPFYQLEHVDIDRDTPDDGLGLSRVHGWALGALNTNGLQTYYVDDIELHGRKSD